jgi:hypothetical protein
VRGAVVLLVPADPSRWRSTGSFLPGITEADGTFKIRAAPGSYLLMVVGERENPRALNEAYIRTRSAGAKTLTLAPHSRETIELLAPSNAP